MADEFSQYDDARRRGVFDKCNGRAPAFIRDEDDAFIAAYFDGYDANEVKIGEPQSEELEVEFIPEETVFQLWIEGDWGQYDLLFRSEKGAIAWANDTFANWENQEETWPDYDTAAGEGLAGIIPLTLLP
jgi:hypothetical protein